MRDEEKSKKQLIHELKKMRNQVVGMKEEHSLLKNLMDNIPDHIYFKDRGSRFIMINKALAKLFSLSDPGEALGKTDFDFFTEEHARQAYEDEQEIITTGKPIAGKEEKETWPDGKETWVSTSKVPFYDENKKIIGVLGVSRKIIGTFGISRDITDKKKLEDERKELIHDLQKALADVKTLSGLLPICSYCKKIRDDKGYWQEVDHYVQKHTKALFSHGMCPECSKKVLKSLDT